MKDLADIPDNVKSGLEIVPVSNVDEVLSRALIQPLTPIEWNPAEQPAVSVPADDGADEAVITH